MSAGEIVAAGAVGTACGIVLNVFYLAVRHAWPENYFGLGGSVDPVVSRNIGRYALFRFAPPFVMVAAAGITGDRLGYSAAVSVLVAVLVHVVRPLHDIIVRALHRQWGSVIGRTSVLLLVVGVSVLAFILKDLFSPVVPRPSELVANLWAGVLAAIGAVYLQGIALVRSDPGLIVRRSFSEIDMDVGRYAISASEAQGVHPHICLAVMAAENAQRPNWVRKFESIVPARLRTSGIMQQMGARSDRESVDLALERYFKRWGPPELTYDGEGIAEYWLEDKAIDYNPDRDFAALARIAVEALNETPGIVNRFM